MKIVIKGVVQGVGFRPAVLRAAISQGLKGRVWNDGSEVTIVVNDTSKLMDELYRTLPPLAHIDSVEISDENFPDYDTFEIAGSGGTSGGLSIPTDVAVCDECLKEIREKGRRKGYAFTTCTSCGARFTLLSSLPYDRTNTAMMDFPMCDRCREEYESIEDRRCHHQTICCPDCGPKYYIVDKNGKEIEGDPIPEFARRIDFGRIGVAKSWGGMHICSVLENIDSLREWYGRKQKPFAIMVRDIETAKKYASVTKKEEELLTSPNRPIVLCDKISDEKCKNLAPGLDNVGIFLPYTGMQHILFDCLEHDALIMTSANLPGEPMILNDSDVLELGADIYLLHNQRILNRADDTVARVNGGSTQFIRKSRGFIPSFIEFSSRHSAVGIGAQENLTATIGINGRLYSTQHIGNGESFGVVDYLESAADSFMEITDCRPEAVAMDMHPGYANRKYGKKLSEKFSIPIVEVQHHWAHSASLLAEHNAECATVIAIDGTGYGDDGQAWGGEVLESTLRGYKRMAHLEYVPLIGSEKALYDLRRLKFAYDCMNGIDTRIFDENDSELLRKIMKNSISSSSLGRFLDALSFALGVCNTRTYDGEPAMKIEPLLSRGKSIDGFETETVSGVIGTAHLLKEFPKGAKKEDVAYSAVKSVIDELVNRACDVSRSGVIGLTGGCSYNGPISRMAEDAAGKRGMKLLMHSKVPNGDGGISLGQVAIALRSLE